MICCGGVNVKHLEHPQECFAMTGIESPEEWLIAIAMMRASERALLLKSGDASFPLKNLPDETPHFGIILCFCGGLENLRQHFDQVLRDFSFAGSDLL